MKYQVTKHYGHDRGTSIAYRQWKAPSHCRLMHGYSLAINITFETDELDYRGWVIDFGGLRDIRAWIEQTFDHVTLVAEDDPELSWFEVAANRGILDLRIVPTVGCEAFAGLIAAYVGKWLMDTDYAPRVRLHSIEVHEHGANKAVWLAG